MFELLRKEKLEQIAIAYLPTGESAVPVRARPETASTAAAVRTPLIRDDHGGVLVGAGSLEGSDVTVITVGESGSKGSTGGVGR